MMLPLAEISARRPADAGPGPVLEVTDLKVLLRGNREEVQAVDGLSFSLGRGETVCVVGESGSGKSVTALTVMGLLGNVSKQVSGSVRLNGAEILDAPESDLRRRRGLEVGMVFQDPLSSLNPAMRVGEQIVEALNAHDRRDLAAAQARMHELLTLVGIPRPEIAARQYPHEFSGGMRQRVMIAIAIANNPSLIIADEPTTALDVTVQAQVMALLKEIQVGTGSALMLITHNLGIVSQMADRVLVMYAGRIVEQGDVGDIFASPQHPYTRALLQSIPRANAGGKGSLYQIPGAPPNLAALPAGCAFHPRCQLAGDRALCRDSRPLLRPLGAGAVACHFAEEQGKYAPPATARTVPDAAAGTGEPILVAEGLAKIYALRGGLFNRRATFEAVSNVDLSVERGATLAIVGESGCGKSSLARMLVRLSRSDRGKLRVLGEDVTQVKGARLRQFWRDAQMVMQDPYSALDPRMTVRRILSEPFRGMGIPVMEKKLLALLADVGLSPTHLDRFPHEFSGGQRQRIVIARALAVKPKVLVLDEPVSALDVSIQAQIVNLLVEIQKENGLAYVFISHDLSVVENIADAVAVMYLGKVVERGPKAKVFRSPAHPYTKALLSAAPTLPLPGEAPRERILLKGDAPGALSDRTGCSFRHRCWKAQAICASVTPPLAPVDGNHASACHFARETMLDSRPSRTSEA